MCTVRLVIHQLFFTGMFCHCLLSPCYSQIRSLIGSESSPHLVEHQCVNMLHSLTNDWLIVRPSSRTSAQHYISIGSMSRAPRHLLYVTVNATLPSTCSSPPLPFSITARWCATEKCDKSKRNIGPLYTLLNQVTGMN